MLIGHLQAREAMVDQKQVFSIFKFRGSAAPDPFNLLLKAVYFGFEYENVKIYAIV